MGAGGISSASCYRTSPPGTDSGIELYMQGAPQVVLGTSKAVRKARLYRESRAMKQLPLGGRGRDDREACLQRNVCEG